MGDDSSLVWIKESVTIPLHYGSCSGEKGIQEHKCVIVLKTQSHQLDGPSSGDLEYCLSRYAEVKITACASSVCNEV